MDAFEVCRELEVLDSVKVEGTGRRDHGTIVYDEGNFRLAHELNRKIRAGANGLLRMGSMLMRCSCITRHLFDRTSLTFAFTLKRKIRSSFLSRRKQLKRCADGIQCWKTTRLATVALGKPRWRVGLAGLRRNPFLGTSGAQ